MCLNFRERKTQTNDSRSHSDTQLDINTISNVQQQQQHYMGL